MADKSEIIKQLSEKYKVSQEQIEKAVNSQFKFAKQLMEKQDMPAVRLPYFGKFIINKRKLNHIKRHERNKTNGQSSTEKEEKS